MTASRGAPSKGSTTPPTPLNDAPLGGFFLPEKVSFQKPALSLDEQLNLLESRGLTISDHALARGYLEHISYYRLSGYTRYFTRADDDKHEQFRDGVTFNDVINLYIFDRRLRSLMAEAFERVEIAVKGQLAYHGSTLIGPFWMTDPANFDAGSHGKIAKIIEEACRPPRSGKHKQQFLEAFFRKYSDPVPPAWMLTEVMSFHGASLIFNHSRGSVRVPVAKAFAVHQSILESWLHSLVFARNVCAHHGRFWNRRFTIEPKIPKNYEGVWPESSRNRLYVTCCILHHLLSGLGGDTTWTPRLRELISNRPNVPLDQMGFPEDWDDLPFWGFERELAQSAAAE